MTHPSTTAGPVEDRTVNKIHKDLHAAFDRLPDSANILQGVRQFRKGRPHVRVTLYPSPKNSGAFIPCEGRLERAMAESLECDPTVTRYRAQPLAIPVERGRSLVPDFVVEHNDHTFTLIDVKPADRLVDPRVIDRMRRIRTILKQARVHHRLITDHELHTQPAYQIRECLRRGATVTLSTYDRQEFLKWLTGRTVPLSACRQEAITRGLPPLSIEHLALRGDITFPIQHQWSDYSLLEVSHASNSEPTAARGTIHTIRVPI